MLRIEQAVIVEGKYDKIKLESIIQAPIFTTEGFSLFKDKEKMALIKKLAEKNGIIILTDSDSAGFLIRNHIASCVAPDKIINVYIPDIYGKERRKTSPGKEGKVGVEGVDKQVLLKAFERAGVFAGGAEKSGRQITKNDLFLAGLTGGEDAKRRRCELLFELSLPQRMSTNALLKTLNIFLTYEEFAALCEEKGWFF